MTEPSPERVSEFIALYREMVEDGADLEEAYLCRRCSGIIFTEDYNAFMCEECGDIFCEECWEEVYCFDDASESYRCHTCTENTGNKLKQWRRAASAKTEGGRCGF